MPADIPQDSPLGMMLANWDIDPCIRKKDKVKMVQYCMMEWTKKEITPNHVYWTRYGSFESWICQALNTFVNSKEPFNLEEGEYAACWTGDTEPLWINIFETAETPKTEQEEKKEVKGWDSQEMLPSPLLLVPPSQDFPSASAPAMLGFPPAPAPAASLAAAPITQTPATSATQTALVPSAPLAAPGLPYALAVPLFSAAQVDPVFPAPRPR